jgi:hypothetical protein
MAFDSSPVQGPGLEVRQYPLGTIPTLEYRLHITDSLEGLAVGGANIAYHGDQGVQDHEHGIGFGGGVGLRDSVMTSFFVGLRADLWRMSIDWTNTSQANEPPAGTSRFLIVQPTVEIGSNFYAFSNSLWITPTLSFGGEINAFDNDAPTGQGFIVLLGVGVGI